MRQQQIRLCTTGDGVRIAYATMGAGPALVYVCGWPGHLELELEREHSSRFLAELSEGFTLVRYDMRGTGLSDRRPNDLSFAAFLRDLEAVVDRLDLQSFALLALGDLAGPLALSYAASNPERVSALVVNSGYAWGSLLGSPDQRTLLTEFVATFGWPIFNYVDNPEIDAETHRALRELQERGATHEMQATVLRRMYEADVREAAARVRARSLVLHPREDPIIPFDAGRDLAARVPGARFVPYSSESAAPWVNSSVLLAELREFLAPGRSPHRIEPVASDVFSARECEVLVLLAQGRTSREIAAALALSPRTVERHISNIYAKADIHSRAEAAALAVAGGLAETVGNPRQDRR